MDAALEQEAEVVNEYVTVPETTLPNGTVVPAFKVGKYITGRENDALAITATAAPWVEINFADAQSEAEKAGLKLITETQYLAIAHNIAQQAINWTSGIVGEGSIFQGIRDYSVDEAQPGTYESEDADERRWHELSTGERVFDFAGNCYTWIFDDVQGDENGIVAKAFAADSPSITTAPAPSYTKGMGWYPSAGCDLSSYALVRGGCWSSGDYAGVFLLNRDSPDYGNDDVGFRCTFK
ncbi:SUMF1/EgtB/PvdO family nonheme iron enzyme [Solimicrobium silvestre]|uniref:Formylglycine-generating sulfatase enzyme n=1 Tax=Solimicrobium silvestre TaxID=2099400 RepID=A0A2S9GY44_9BURK|nr:SUMF1/EgtB/PvdO family nonheme iron enzyme [Solimicrobium silvestre]PRC92628.1 Formylglycine-generating sulfatase enzyme [Solimicrobium silvestre]